MRRSTGQRTAAVLLAVLAQSTLVALYILPRWQELDPEPQSSPMVLIWPENPPASEPPVRKPQRKPAPPGLPRIEIVSATPGAEAALVAPTITSEEQAPASPAIDLEQAMTQGLQATLREQAEREEHGELLDSKPEVLKIPELRQLPPPVVTQRLDNGDMVTRHRINENLTIVCEHPHMPLALHFDVTARVRPAMCHAVDTHKPLSFDIVKPRYLSKPLPRAKKSTGQ